MWPGLSKNFAATRPRVRLSGSSEPSSGRCGDVRLNVRFRCIIDAIDKWIVAIFVIGTVAFPQQTHNRYEPPNRQGAGQKLLVQFYRRLGCRQEFLSGHWEVDCDERHL